MTQPWDDARLGENTEQFTIETHSALREASAALVAQTRWDLIVLTPDLEPLVYDDQGFVDAVKALALIGGRVSIRFLVADAGPAVRRGHRLIELARRLTSFIHIRQLPEHARDGVEAFIVADRRGVLHRKFAERPEGALCFHAPLHARQLLNRFDSAWNEAETDPELQRLHL